MCQWRQDDLDSYARIGAYSGAMRYIGSGTMKYTQTEEQIAKFLHHWEQRGFGLMNCRRITLRERLIDFISLLYPASYPCSSLWLSPEASAIAGRVPSMR